MLRQLPKKIIRNSAMFPRLTKRSFFSRSSTPTQSTISVEKNNTYKWLLVTMGSFGCGYVFIDKFTSKKNQLSEPEKPKSDLLPKLVNKDCRNLITNLKMCESKFDVEKVLLFGKNNNAFVHQFDDLKEVLTVLFSRQWVESNYFLSFFEDSIKKYVETPDQIRELLIIKNIPSSVINLITVPKIITNIHQLDMIAQCYPDQDFAYKMLLAYFPTAQYKTLLENDNPHILKWLLHIFKKSESSGILLLNSLEDDQLRQIFSTIENLSKILVFREKYVHFGYEPGHLEGFTDKEKIKFLNRLGYQHVYDLVRDLPPLKKKATFVDFPSKYLEENDNFTRQSFSNAR